MGAVDQRGLADQPLQLPASEIAKDIALPHRGAIGLEARQIAVLAERVNAIAVDGRCAARPGSAVIRHGRTQRLRPDFLPIRPIEGDDNAVAAARALDEDTIARNRHRSVAGSKSGRRPDDRRPGRGPFLQEAGLFRQPRAIGALPLGPVSGCMDSGDTEQHRSADRKGFLHPRRIASAQKLNTV